MSMLFSDTFPLPQVAKKCVIAGKRLPGSFVLWNLSFCTFDHYKDQRSFHFIPYSANLASVMRVTETNCFYKCFSCKFMTVISENNFSPLILFIWPYYAIIKKAHLFYVYVI